VQLARRAIEAVRAAPTMPRAGRGAARRLFQARGPAPAAGDRWRGWRCHPATRRASEVLAAEDQVDAAVRAAILSLCTRGLELRAERAAGRWPEQDPRAFCTRRCTCR
jgi:hypothetical protein